jgi:putative tricarboxylic transport membrane protein
MTQYDRISTLFWIALGVAICIESLRIDPGSFSNPGPGLIPLGSGLILGIFGSIVFALSFKKTGDEKEVLWKSGTRWKKLVGILVSIVAYAFLIDFLGFYVVTFLWMFYVCRGIGGMGWKKSLFISLVSTLSSYLLFEKYLRINFPKGLLRF